jgi:hypothetical protein
MQRVDYLKDNEPDQHSAVCVNCWNLDRTFIYAGTVCRAIHDGIILASSNYMSIPLTYFDAT